MQHALELLLRCCEHWDKLPFMVHRNFSYVICGLAHASSQQTLIALCTGVHIPVHIPVIATTSYRVRLTSSSCFRFVFIYDVNK